MSTNKLAFCPCESGKTYSTCCELYHLGFNNQIFSPNAEALMRSRYSAFVLCLENYVLQTWHPDTRPSELNLSNGNDVSKWLGLAVKQYKLLTNSTATVEFIARYKMANNMTGRAEQHHEISQFIKMGYQWFYVDGQII